MICNDFFVVCKIKLIDVVIDVIGGIVIGVEIVLNFILNKKYIVMLNVEIDCVVGLIFKKLVDDVGVIFIGFVGDELGVVMELFDFVDVMGFEVRVIGKGKNNKLDLDCNFDIVREEVERKGVLFYMIVFFKEGIKIMVEMVLMCNVIGFVFDVRGGYGIEVIVNEVFKKYVLKSEGGVLDNYGVVDFVNGIVFGVFVVVVYKLKVVNDELKYLSMGDGFNYILYRLYYLCSLEIFLLVVMVVLDYKVIIVFKVGLVVEVMIIVKKDLKKGEFMDGYGVYICYGIIEKYDVVKVMNVVFIGLISKKIKVVKDIKKGEVIIYDMVEIEKDIILYYLR